MQPAGAAAFVNHSCLRCSNATICYGSVPERIAIRRLRLTKKVGRHEQIFCFYGNDAAETFKCMVGRCTEGESGPDTSSDEDGDPYEGGDE